MLTVACVWVAGNVPYTVDYVANLHAMVDRALIQPYEMVCLTDRPWQVPAGIRSVPIQSPVQRAGWWAKLRLFDASVVPTDTGRVLYLDLDSLIVGGLDAIADSDSAFATIPDPHSSFQPKNGLRVIKRFNSSVMVFDAGVYRDLWSAWSPSVADRLWGDQDWLAERHPEADRLPAGWFPRLSSIGPSGDVPDEARVILAKKPKPAEASRRWPWVRELWEAA